MLLFLQLNQSELGSYTVSFSKVVLSQGAENKVILGVFLYETPQRWIHLTFRGTKGKNLFNKMKKENYLFIY